MINSRFFSVVLAYGLAHKEPHEDQKEEEAYVVGPVVSTRFCDLPAGVPHTTS